MCMSAEHTQPIHLSSQEILDNHSLDYKLRSLQSKVKMNS